MLLPLDRKAERRAYGADEQREDEPRGADGEALLETVAGEVGEAVRALDARRRRRFGRDDSRDEKRLGDLVFDRRTERTALCR